MKRKNSGGSARGRGPRRRLEGDRPKDRERSRAAPGDRSRSRAASRSLRGESSQAQPEAQRVARGRSAPRRDAARDGAREGERRGAGDVARKGARDGVRDRSRKGPRKDDRSARDDVRGTRRTRKDSAGPDSSRRGPFRAGYVALLGRPNVGKSTILNSLLGQKIAATTHKPQTTRRNLLGVLHVPGAQVLLLDTPGHHRAEGRLNRFMVGEAERAAAEADVIAWVVDVKPGVEARLTPGNERLAELIRRSGKKVVVLINKADRLRDKTSLLPLMKVFGDLLSEKLAAVVPISAMKKQGLDRAVRELVAALPEGPPLYDEDTITPSTERELVAEILREKIMLETQQELPYAAAVTIEDFEDERPEIVRIQAIVHVERESQKGIIIGKAGERLKAIGIRARADIEYLLDAHVYLGLDVRVSENWSEDARLMRQFGYVQSTRRDLGDAP